ncbi:MAG: hypothetical protein QOH81_2989 [Sphingomonadales bacterium]|jgi:hypothetical protein|nr:hypothetical protein [Sphingomonadales bacterium]
MADQSLKQAEGVDGMGEPPTQRREWLSPAVRSLKTSEAELGPVFPATDGIEGHS